MNHFRGKCFLVTNIICLELALCYDKRVSPFFIFMITVKGRSCSQISFSTTLDNGSWGPPGEYSSFYSLKSFQKKINYKKGRTNDHDFMSVLETQRARRHFTTYVFLEWVNVATFLKSIIAFLFECYYYQSKFSKFIIFSCHIIIFMNAQK